MKKYKIEEVDDATFAEIKKENNGKAVQFSAEDKNGKEQDYVVVAPDRATLDAIAFNMENNNSVKVRQVMRKNCIVAGNEDILEDDTELWSAVSEQILNLIEKKKATIKKR